MSEDSSDRPETEPKKISKRFRLKPVKKNKRAKTFGDPARVIITAFFIFLGSQFLAALILQLLLKLTGFYNGGTDFQESPPVQFLYVLAAEGLVFWLVWTVLKNRGLSLDSIGLRRGPKSSDAALALAGFVVFYLALIILTIFISQIFPGLDTDQAQDVGFKNANTFVEMILAFTALVVLVPVGEEVLVRGYLYSGLRASLRFLPAMLITSLLFAVAHLPSGKESAILWTAAVNTFVLSAVLVYLREKTGAIYAGIMVHSLNNLVAFLVYFHT